MTQTAVVILNYNGQELLKKFLPSVLKFSGKAKIIVADNNSSDGSVDVLTKEFPQVEVVRIPGNLGFSGGYNYAFSKIEAEYFVLLNSDVEVTEKWIEPVISLFENNPSIGAAQPKILSYSERQKQQMGFAFRNQSCHRNGVGYYQNCLAGLSSSVVKSSYRQ